MFQCQCSTHNPSFSSKYYREVRFSSSSTQRWCIQCVYSGLIEGSLQKPEGYVPPPDSTMDNVYSLANQLGPCPELPDSLRDFKYTTTFLDYTDKEIINPFFHSLKTEDFILKVDELTRERILDVGDGGTRANITLRLWCGCADSAKTIRDTSVAHYQNGTKKDQPIPPEEREIAWYQLMQPRSEEDLLYIYRSRSL